MVENVEDYFTVAFVNAVQVRYGIPRASSTLIAEFYGDDRFIEAKKYCKLKQEEKEQKGAKNQ